MTRLELSGAGETIDLNSIMDTDEGIQAIEGLTGFGLPPVSQQWIEGAGDGAKNRGKKVGQRDIDLPLHIVMPERELLKEEVARLARVLADKCRLTWFDENEYESWYVDVWRVGGGDYVYGEDTVGNRELDLVISLRTETPYWTRNESIEVSNKGNGIPEVLKLNNPGTAPAQLKWEVSGPAVRWIATRRDNGQELRYDKVIMPGETLYFDGSTGTVKDAFGNNRYDGLADAPRFFDLKPGENVIDMVMVRDNAEFTELLGARRYNYVVNPSFRKGFENWSIDMGQFLPGSTLMTYDAPLNRVYFRDFSKRWSPNPARLWTTITGLSIGESYNFKVKATNMRASTYNTGTSWKVYVNSGPTIYNTGPLSPLVTEVEMKIPSVQSNSLTISIVGPYDYGRREIQGQFAIDEVFLSEEVYYFDGNTADTDNALYSWEGTPDASRSVLQIPVNMDLTQSQVKASFDPRDWMVV